MHSRSLLSGRLNRRLVSRSRTPLVICGANPKKNNKGKGSPDEQPAPKPSADEPIRDASNAPDPTVPSTSNAAAPVPSLAPAPAPRIITDDDWKALDGKGLPIDTILPGLDRERMGGAASPSRGADALPAESLLRDNPVLVRKLTSMTTGVEVLNAFLADVAAAGRPPLRGLSPEECLFLVQQCFDKGNDALAVSIYNEMRRTPLSASLTSGNWDWPPVSQAVINAVVLGLAKFLRVNDALQIVDEVRKRGVPAGQEVAFGYVVTSPLAPTNPLIVVQPQLGAQQVACAETRLEFELFSGTVIKCESEGVTQDPNFITAALRAVGLWRRPKVGAVHNVVITAPSGESRTFRFSTASADVPCQPAERITVVCAPSTFSKRGSVLGARAPGREPGEPMQVTNHVTGRVAPVARAPPSANFNEVPAWLIPAILTMSAGDAATQLLDPMYPLLGAGVAASVTATYFVGDRVLLPKLRMLPETALKVEVVRQRLLSQHDGLVKKMRATQEGAREDIRVLARLWQLQQKMEAVGAEGYEARIGRVRGARQNLESRIEARLDLIERYSRVINMIEIEVEIDSELPAAELVGIEEQLARLMEVEDVQAQWRLQAEAQDEVERLLRGAGAGGPLSVDAGLPR